MAPSSSGADPNTAYVVFGFRHIVKGFNLKNGDGDDAGNFIDSLRMRCTMTWAELRVQDRKRLGGEKIAEALKIGIPASLPEKKKDELLSFRFGADMERFIGYRDGATFEIVWIDHAGECYDH